MTRLNYYTDGGCKNSIGAWGVICVHDTVTEQRVVFKKSNNAYKTTSNRMELWSGLVALTNAVNMLKINNIDEINIYSDSVYLINGLNNDWLTKWEKQNYLNRHGKEIINLDVWKKLSEKVFHINALAKMKDCSVNYKWVEGHNGNPYNEEVDKLVTDKIYSGVSELDK